jgi:hypothetical protein
MGLRKFVAGSALFVAALLAVPVAATGSPRDWHSDVQSFKGAAVETYGTALHDGYLANTESAVDDCDRAAELDGSGVDDNWVAAEGNASENLRSLSPNSDVAIKILASAAKDFTPWRGPGQFSEKEEATFDFKAENLVKDVRRLYDVVDTLDLSNTMINAHQCGPARAQVEKASADLDLDRKILSYTFGKLTKWVAEKAS